VKMARQQLAQSLGREPSLQEVAEQSGLSVEEVVMATEASAEVESIYKPVYQADGSEVYLADKLAAGVNGEAVMGENLFCEDREKEQLLNHMLLEQLLSELDEKELSLIKMRYFQDKTQTEVAKHMGISQVQVSRLEKRILIRMREKVI